MYVVYFVAMMMFNGLVCVDSDASDISKDSGGGSSCAGACDQFYRNKLMATLQILENKEETIRVQGSSLGVAEERIATLTERATMLRKELDSKAQELRKLHQIAENSRIDKTDISISAELQDVEKQRNMVNTLQDNLSMIEELYRECFYETAKQEELIDLLRKSYLDVRLMDKDKSKQIDRLQNVINTQKWSIEQCQDVVVEVENLKAEISNFLNSSNNDSGMWERGSEPGVADDLQDIMDQLHQLKGILSGDCTCGLEEENMELKGRNENLEIKLEKLQQRVGELETSLLKNDALDQDLQKKIEQKEIELQKTRQKLAKLEEGSKDQSTTCEGLARQLQQAQVLLNGKTAELLQSQQRCNMQETTIQELQAELDKADQIIKENVKIRQEVLQLTQQVSQWRSSLSASEAQVRDLQEQLHVASAHCRELELCCREKDRCACALQAQLEEAHARGAALCAESRRVTHAVRHWMRRQRALAREQQQKIKEQEATINCLRSDSTHSNRTSASENEPCCSKCLPRASETNAYSRRASETNSFTSCVQKRSSETCTRCDERTSGSEIASCSSVPMPPKRMSRKRLPPCGDIRCRWAAPAREHECRRVRIAPLPREMSPTEVLVERMEHLNEGMLDCHRRWAKR